MTKREAMLKIRGFEAAISQIQFLSSLGRSSNNGNSVRGWVAVLGPADKEILGAMHGEKRNKNLALC